MSYKWGVNGNDLEWSAIEELNSFLPELEVAIFEEEAEFDQYGNVTDEYYEGISDSNPTVVYYKGNINIQRMLKEGKKIEDLADWFIIHDTNGNHVTLVGDVPDDYLTEDYIKDRNKEEAGV